MEVLRKSMFSYAKMIGGCLYLYNSLVGSTSLTKISNPTYISEIIRMINSNDYTNGSPNIIELLKEIGYLTALHKDEEKKQRMNKRLDIMRSNDLVLTIMPTTMCNFKCIYCYENYSPIEMSESTQQDIVDFVAQRMQKCDHLFVNWFGGEPLLALETIKTLSREFMRITTLYKKTYMAGMTTNGYLLTPDVVKELLKYRVVDYQITVDGTEKLHDALRKHRNNTGTYKTIVNNLMEIKKSIKSSILKFTIRTNYTKESLANIEQVFDVLKTIEGKMFNFSIKMVSDWGGEGVHDIGEELLQSSDSPYIINCFCDDAHSLDFSSHVDAFESRRFICGASKKNSYVIYPDGSIHKCTVDFSDEYGNVNAPCVKTLAEKEIALEVADFSSQCDECFFSGCCLGIACPKALRDNKSPCPPEKLYIDQFFQLLPDKCFRCI